MSICEQLKQRFGGKRDNISQKMTDRNGNKFNKISLIPPERNDPETIFAWEEVWKVGWHNECKGADKKQLAAAERGVETWIVFHVLCSKFLLPKRKAEMPVFVRIPVSPGRPSEHDLVYLASFAQPRDVEQDT